MSSTTVREGLEEHEIFCPVCKGLGKKPGTDLVCKKCHGDGKLDWLENIVGKRKKHHEFYFQVKDLQDSFADGILKELTESMAEQMAKEIDREIMRQILGRER